MLELFLFVLLALLLLIALIQAAYPSVFIIVGAAEIIHGLTTFLQESLSLRNISLLAGGASNGQFIPVIQRFIRKGIIELVIGIILILLGVIWKKKNNADHSLITKSLKFCAAAGCGLLLSGIILLSNSEYNYQLYVIAAGNSSLIAQIRVLCILGGVFTAGGFVLVFIAIAGIRKALNKQRNLMEG